MQNSLFLLYLRHSSIVSIDVPSLWNNIQEKLSGKPAKTTTSSKLLLSIYMIMNHPSSSQTIIYIPFSYIIHGNPIVIKCSMTALTGQTCSTDPLIT